MKDAILILNPQMTELQDKQIRQTVQKESGRLFDFIRRRVPEREDAEDILQDVFYEFTENTRLMKPIEQIASWLFGVARNKIADLYRKQKPEPLKMRTGVKDEDDLYLNLAEILPSKDESADTKMLREMIMDELEEALDELPVNQREVFVQNEFEDKTFEEISKDTGVPLNTLLSRKRYAVLYLRKRLQTLYNEIINS